MLDVTALVLLRSSGPKLGPFLLIVLLRNNQPSWELDGMCRAAPALSRETSPGVSFPREALGPFVFVRLTIPRERSA
jgi:hypothetical protein